MLTPKQKLFIKAYLIDGNAKRAAIASGYSKKTAKSQGSRLLTNVDIRSELDKGTEKRCEKLQITADYVLGGIREIAENCKAKMPMASLKGYELLGKHLKLFTDVVEEHRAKDLNFGSIPIPDEFNQPRTVDKPN